MKHGLDLRSMAQKSTARGPSVSDDTAVYITAIVYDWDPDKASVQIGINGGVVWCPAMPGRYSTDSLARVLVDEYSGRPTLVMSPVFPESIVSVMPCTAVVDSSTIKVNPYGTEYTIPSDGGTYTAGLSAYCITNDWGIPVYAIAPNDRASGAGSTASAPGKTTTKAATATIGPQYSGTYKVSSSRWDSWNPNRYGGRSDMYQGQNTDYNSGTLRGFAAYGSQIVNLHAVSIESMTFKARKNDVNGLSARLKVQGSPNGSKPSGSPSSSGDVVQSNVVIGPGKWGTVTLTADMREGFRTGSYKGLVLVGTDYGGFGGTATAGSFVFTIKYTKKV